MDRKHPNAGKQIAAAHRRKHIQDRSGVECPIAGHPLTDALGHAWYQLPAWRKAGCVSKLDKRKGVSLPFRPDGMLFPKKSFTCCIAWRSRL